jgi:hypothetical protein
LWVRVPPPEASSTNALDDGDGYHESQTKLIIAGDFQAGYLIADRLGMSVELIPHLFGATNRFPTGQRGLFAIWAHGWRRSRTERVQISRGQVDARREHHCIPGRDSRESHSRFMLQQIR